MIMFKVMLSVLFVLTASISWASVVECRFGDIYFKYNGDENFYITTDDGKYSSGKAEGIQLGNTYYSIKELLNL